MLRTRKSLVAASLVVAVVTVGGVYGYLALGGFNRLDPHSQVTRQNAVITTTPATTVSVPPSIMELQYLLDDLGYQARKVDGKLDDETTHAIVAFQKVQGLPRTGELTADTLAALKNPKIISPKSISADTHLEVDLTRQVGYVVSDGRVGKIYDVSTGAAGDSATPAGEFHVLRQVNHLDHGPLGPLYRPSYITYDGIAIHGGEPVEPQPASHGCVRMTNPSIDELYPSLSPGTRVIIYRSPR